MITQSFRFDLYSSDGLYLRELEGVLPSGQITGNVNASIKWSGSITYQGDAIARDQWYKYRIKPVLLESRDGGARVEVPLGVYVVRPGKQTYKAGKLSTPLNLYDRTFIAKSDAVDSTFSIPAGAVITSQIRALLSSTGEKNLGITSEPAQLSSAMVWEAGTSKLKIINELLQASGFFSLWCDFAGAFRIEKYVAPASRPVAYTFTDREDSIHTSDWVRNQRSQVPNKIICVSQESGDTPALVSTVTNVDPASPYSFQNQGVWVAETHTGVEASSQAVLDSIALRYLSTAVSSATRERSMLATPFDLSSLVINAEGGREVVENIKISLKPSDLMKITTREVA